FQTLLRPNQQARNFRFQVRANDAVTEWLPVEVAPAPTLTALQVNLFFPEYTGLSPRTLPQNNGNVAAVAGTVVSLKPTPSASLSTPPGLSTAPRRPPNRCPPSSPRSAPTARRRCSALPPSASTSPAGTTRTCPTTARASTCASCRASAAVAAIASIWWTTPA